jgi:hypothetical protein
VQLVIVDGFLNVLRLQNHGPSVNTLILEGVKRGGKRGLISKIFVRLAPLNRLGGAERDRTVDLMTASHALSQLSYSPNNGKFFLTSPVIKSQYIFNFS